MEIQCMLVGQKIQSNNPNNYQTNQPYLANQNLLFDQLNQLIRLIRKREDDYLNIYEKLKPKLDHFKEIQNVKMGPLDIRYFKQVSDREEQRQREELLFLSKFKGSKTQDIRIKSMVNRFVTRVFQIYDGDFQQIREKYCGDDILQKYLDKFKTIVSNYMEIRPLEIENLVRFILNFSKTKISEEINQGLLSYQSDHEKKSQVDSQQNKDQFDNTNQFLMYEMNFDEQERFSQFLSQDDSFKILNIDFSEENKKRYYQRLNHFMKENSPEQEQDLKTIDQSSPMQMDDGTQNNNKYAGKENGKSYSMGRLGQPNFEQKREFKTTQQQIKDTKNIQFFYEKNFLQIYSVMGDLDKNYLKNFAANFRMYKESYERHISQGLVKNQEIKNSIADYAEKVKKLIVKKESQLQREDSNKNTLTKSESTQKIEKNQIIDVPKEKPKDSSDKQPESDNQSSKINPKDQKIGMDDSMKLMPNQHKKSFSVNNGLYQCQTGPQNIRDPNVKLRCSLQKPLIKATKNLNILFPTPQYHSGENVNLYSFNNKSQREVSPFSKLSDFNQIYKQELQSQQKSTRNLNLVGSFKSVYGYEKRQFQFEQQIEGVENNQRKYTNENQYSQLSTTRRQNTSSSRGGSRISIRKQRVEQLSILPQIAVIDSKTQNQLARIKYNQREQTDTSASRLEKHNESFSFFENSSILNNPNNQKQFSEQDQLMILEQFGEQKNLDKHKFDVNSLFNKNKDDDDKNQSEVNSSNLLGNNSILLSRSLIRGGRLVPLQTVNQTLKFGDDNGQSQATGTTPNKNNNNSMENIIKKIDNNELCKNKSHLGMRFTKLGINQKEDCNYNFSFLGKPITSYLSQEIKNHLQSRSNSPSQKLTFKGSLSNRFKVIVN